MYDFLLSESWWVETLILAFVIATIVIIVIVFTYNEKFNEKLKSIESALPEKKPEPPERPEPWYEAKELAREHKGLSKDHVVILERCRWVEALMNMQTSEITAIHMKLTELLQLNKLCMENTNQLHTLQNKYDALKKENQRLCGQYNDLKQKYAQSQENASETPSSFPVHRDDS